jgi:sulfatase maturation enzyme AslB (radical SAM superfamily)
VTKNLDEFLYLPLGELFLHSPAGIAALFRDLLTVVEVTVRKRINIFLATNLLKMEIELFRNILILLNHQRHTVLTSFDSINMDEMNRIRGGDVYRDVVENLTSFLHLRSALKSQVRFQTCLVLQPDNTTSALETIRTLLAMGVDSVIVQPIHNYDVVTEDTYLQEGREVYDTAVASRLIRATDQLFCFAQTDDRVLLTDQNKQHWQTFFLNPLSLAGPCNSTRQLYIDPYGNYRGCLSGAVLNNVRESDIQLLLRSSTYGSFQKFAGRCKLCIHGCS